MKRFTFMFLLSLLIFTQCKKKEDDYDAGDKTVPVRFEIPLEQFRSDFKNLFPDGNIKWGNKNNVEYLYLAVPNVYSHTDASLNYVQRFIGQMYEMKAECDEATDKLIFTADIQQNLFWSGLTLDMYYFGNNRGDEGNSNVVSIYDELKPEYFIGKKIMFDKQTGDIEDVGNYHVATMPVVVKTVREGTTILEVKLQKGAPDFRSITSVAVLDLEGETELRGPRIKSLAIKWNGKVFEHMYEYFPEATYDVSDNAGEKSFITLPPDPERLVLECNKGHYVFENGIEQNQVYVGRNGNSLDEIQPLSWETP